MTDLTASAAVVGSKERLFVLMLVICAFGGGATTLFHAIHVRPIRAHGAAQSHAPDKSSAIIARRIIDILNAAAARMEFSMHSLCHTYYREPDLLTTGWGINCAGVDTTTMRSLSRIKCLMNARDSANKRAVLEELKRTLALRDQQPRIDGIQQQAQKLTECRDRLNRHVTALHAPLGSSGVSAFRTIGMLVSLRAANVTTARFQLPQCLEWSADQVEQQFGLVEDLARHVERLGKQAE